MRGEECRIHMEVRSEEFNDVFRQIFDEKEATSFLAIVAIQERL